MLEQFRDVSWSKYTEKTLWHSSIIGIIIGVLVVFGYIIMTMDYPNFEYDDRMLALVAIIGIIITIVIAYTNQVYQNKQLQTTSMTKIFELLSSIDIRTSREKVHKEYCKLKNSQKEISFNNSDDPHMKDYVDKVISSFDQVSVLVLNDLVDKELFFDTYGEMIVRDWNTLEVEIKRRQENNPRTARHFTALKKRFLKRIEKENSRRDENKKIDTEPYCEE